MVAATALSLLCTTARSDTLLDPILAPPQRPIAPASLLVSPAASSTATTRASSDREFELEGYAEPVAVVTIPVLQLNPPGLNEFGVRLEQPSVGMFRLEVNGASVDLTVQSSVWDPKSQTRTFTATDSSGTDAQAWLTVTSDGLAVGTLEIQGDMYRILPQDADHQVVYRVGGMDQPSSGSSLTIARSHVSNRVRNLEKRHSQLLQIAQVAPESILTSENGGTIVVRGGKLGKLQAIQETEVERVLANLAPLAGIEGQADIRLAAVRQYPGGSRIEFEQVLNGIPFEHRGFLRLNADNSIAEVSARLIRNQFVRVGRRISQQEALSSALAAIDRQRPVEHKDSSGEYELLNDPELSYQRIDSTPSFSPRYRFDIRTADFNWRVHVDALTGESEAFDPRQFDDPFGYRICRDNSSTENPQTCTSPGADIIWERPHGSFVRCRYRDPRNPNTLCHLDDAAEANRAMSDAFRILGEIHDSNPSYCCDRLGGQDRVVDILPRSSGAPQDNANAYYDPTTQTIMSQPTSGALRNLDIVWHELGHHVFYMYNAEVSNQYSRGTFPAAVVEGFADTFSVALQLATQFPSWVGDPHVVGDGPYPTDNPRFLNDTRITFQRFADPNLSDHKRGEAIGSLFYRIKVASGMSNRRFLEFVLQSTERLTDFDGNGLDLMDVQNALLLAANGESALIGHVIAKFNEMNTFYSGPSPLPPAAPIPNGAPQTSPGLSRGPFTCSHTPDGSPSTRWPLSWTAVPGATSYMVYMKGTHSAYHTTVAAHVPGTSVVAGIWGRNALGAYHSAFITVSACNANGCGRPSNPIVIEMRPECDM
ncbi:hypothetical protein HNQ60_000554 [Povalibacter uvarum]|uniref:Uncharacterized protein n=1 Tax=Povalibacter uvarum TaxID=732238 RepID=A0A841HHF3_9GAMM|nr:hypothetical protein [Povalibacter uvarum]MBB6091708.1 hypothetical protein [Povalibacter uvarum]